MTLAADLARFADKLEDRRARIHAGVVQESFTSIVDGSPLTGAPGQPVKSGRLRNSWDVVEETPSSTLIRSDEPYAVAVEENHSGVAYGNHGPHSVALTRAAFPRVLEAVAERVVSETGGL